MIKPWKHQKEGVKYIKNKDGILYAWGMGSGKTIGTLHAAMEINAKTILIITPKSVLTVWEQEVNKFAQNEFEIKAFITGSVKKKTEQIDLFLKQTSRKRKIVVINYESAWREGLGEIRVKRRITNIGLLRSINWDMIILDEAHKICRSTSNISKFCGRLSQSAKKRLALSGTPLPNGCLSAHGMFRFLEPEIFGTSEYRFRMRYAIYGGFEGRQVIEYVNQEDFKKRYSSITHQVKTRDVVELPEVSHIEVLCDLSAKAMKQYNEFKNECILDIANSVITAENVLVKTLRLSQMASGCVTDEEGTSHIIDTSKVDAVSETIEGIDDDEPIVVFGRFRAEIDSLALKLEKNKITHSFLIGGRNELIDWQQGKTRVLVVNIQSGALGIDCTRAKYTLYMSTGYNYANYDQSLARTCRPGADVNKKLFYYHFNARNTIDHTVSQAMIRKENLIDTILNDLYRFKQTT